MLRHVSSRRCLEIDVENIELFVASCSPKLPSQKWLIQKLDEAALQKWDEM